jgi:hypothetical protein
MSDAIHWTCPHCDRDTTIREGDFREGSHFLTTENADGPRVLDARFTVCPNPECRKLTLVASLWEISVTGSPTKRQRLLEHWNLIPPSKAKSYPAYVPEAVREDYEQACLICDSSPKASATLSRRCIQGILRDFWHVKPGKLVDEIEQVKDRMDPLTWEAIDSVRRIGNIGAHMEKDINLIVDVDPDEAVLLTELIEMLVRDWYVAREERKRTLTAIKAVGDHKQAAREQAEPDGAT